MLHTPDQLAPTGDRSAPPPHACRHPFLPMAEARGLLDETPMKTCFYIGQLALRATHSFNIISGNTTVHGISYRFCSVLHCCDGYEYGRGNAVL